MTQIVLGVCRFTFGERTAIVRNWSRWNNICLAALASALLVQWTIRLGATAVANNANELSGEGYDYPSLLARRGAVRDFDRASRRTFWHRQITTVADAGYSGRSDLRGFDWSGINTDRLTPLICRDALS
ncbi:MAG: hypothetical protein U0892_03130 [Pirellulales bacterium]